jgi:hypothetical protein
VTLSGAAASSIRLRASRTCSQTSSTAISVARYAQDDLDSLQEMLAQQLTAVEVEVVGCVVLFSGRA